MSGRHGTPCRCGPRALPSAQARACGPKSMPCRPARHGQITRPCQPEARRVQNTSKNSSQQEVFKFEVFFPQKSFKPKPKPYTQTNRQDKKIHTNQSQQCRLKCRHRSRPLGPGQPAGGHPRRPWLPLQPRSSTVRVAALLALSRSSKTMHRLPTCETLEEEEIKSIH